MSFKATVPVRHFFVFRIKICGITNVDDALVASAAGADAIGLNFFAGSLRRVGHDEAAAILAALPPGVAKAGVFVNHALDVVVGAFDGLKLDLIQLHGDEPPEFLADLEGRPVMRAFRLGPEGLTPVLSYLDRCRELECPPRMVLLDAHQPGAYGGTGTTCDWEAAGRFASGGNVPPLVLAGGLSPPNVAQAISVAGPHAVDTASGVESAPGRKDPALVRAFVAAARGAFAMSATR
jgi:phosphoribosylanthranilate isomerase